MHPIGGIVHLCLCLCHACVPRSYAWISTSERSEKCKSEDANTQTSLLFLPPCQPPSSPIALDRLCKTTSKMPTALLWRPALSIIHLSNWTVLHLLIIMFSPFSYARFHSFFLSFVSLQCYTPPARHLQKPTTTSQRAHVGRRCCTHRRTVSATLTYQPVCHPKNLYDTL